MPRLTRPHEIVATVPAEHLVAALVRHVADTVSGRVAYHVQNETGGFAVVAAWPEQAAAGGELTGSAREVAREPVTGGGVVLVTGPRRWGAPERAVFREAVGWIDAAAAVDRLRADRDRAQVRARALRAELTAAGKQFAEVRELERHRLVRAITTTTLADLDHVRRQLRRMSETPRENRADGGSGGSAARELAQVRDALDKLIDDFRTVVRGVYPSMLPDGGPRTALEELAATLPGAVRFRGDLGRRVEWQVESGLYHAVAAVLNTLAGRDTADGNAFAGTVAPAVTVDFHRDDALGVWIGAPAGGLSADELWTALDHDAKRLAVLGGRMDCTVTGRSAVVTIRLPERLNVVGAATPPLRFERNAFWRRVWELVRQGQQATGGGPDRPSWNAVAARLAGPARLVVVREPSADPVSAADVARASALDVTVIDAEGPADQALAQELLADDGPRGSIDAVLCLVPPAPAFRTALRQGTQRVVLSESASQVELVRTLVARGPVIAARRAVVSTRELVSRLPADHPLRWSFDRIAAEAHEVAELDLLDEIERGDPRLLRSVGRDVTADALRLLGVRGTDPRTRLGLAVDATDAEVRAAAGRAVELWRIRAGRPATGGRDRDACEVLVRTAEGLFSVARTP